MNTKKITALALAALMAAGSTSTVFAMKADDALDFVDATVYEDNDGVLEKDDDGIAPGDTVYFRLEEDQKADDKDKKRLNVYADWKVGGSHIESIDIVYKKGNFQSNSNSQVTGYKYTFKAGKLVEAVTIPGAKLDDAALKKNDAVKEAITKAYTVKEGYTENKTYYADAAALVKGMSSTYTATKLYSHNDGTDKFEDSKVADLLKAAGFKASDDASFNGVTAFTTTAENSAKHFGAVKADDTSENYDQAVNKASTTYILEKNGSYYFVDTTNVSNLSTLKDGSEIGIALASADGYKDNSTGLFWTAEAAAEDAVKNHGVKKVSETASVLVGNDGSTVMDIDAAIAEVFGTSPAAEAVHGAKDGYTYWVEVKTKKSDTTKELDVAGTLSIGTSKNKAQDEKNDNKQAVDFTLSNRVEDYNKPGIVEDEYTFEADKNGAVKFSDDAEEVTLYFGANEDAWFTFNAKGQGALNFGYTLKFNKEIADLFPKANIDFISWNAEPATNRTGDLYITADEDTFLYEVTENGIKEVKGAKYDEDEGAWHIRTRKLTSYAVSDIELDTTVKVEGKDEASSNSSTSSKPNGDKHNPDTGR